MSARQRRQCFSPVVSTLNRPQRCTHYCGVGLGAKCRSACNSRAGTRTWSWGSVSGATDTYWKRPNRCRQVGTACISGAESIVGTLAFRPSPPAMEWHPLLAYTTACTELELDTCSTKPQQKTFHINAIVISLLSHLRGGWCLGAMSRLSVLRNA